MRDLIFKVDTIEFTALSSTNDEIEVAICDRYDTFIGLLTLADTVKLKQSLETWLGQEEL